MDYKNQAEGLEKLKELVENSKNTSVYTAFEVSRLSGVPDYRLPHGNETSPWQGIQMDRLLSWDYFISRPEVVYAWARDMWFSMEDYEPNRIHTLLSEGMQSGRIKNVITENIDMLLQRAGIGNPLELKGSPYLSYCMKCGKPFLYTKVAPVVKEGEIPYCDLCGTIVRPSILFIDEPMNKPIMKKAIPAFSFCNLCIVIGSPTPRKEIIDLFKTVRKDKLVVLSPRETCIDDLAFIKLNDIEGVMRELETSFRKPQPV
ncbi:NAD-dependent protein deacetylase, SIR2 family [Sphaerochaeta pleomorpha str. Grapes]|uniref:protein acetyllysine N-acetyltransferase n=1 Tax=Sphaerochaeta pleomorpha (strain ATCC BAA-1885 / DSM 22778 / Grapes) TaxID=158190 RepID=G8QQQ9_SPHPG|nr:Sir2 family NAD-dependent protein deacetylase [Sphaerochaeta pleomorpha]AEV28690.1 NAD-dependent protein deacetylase, SIR2 family [Sphaerochaeta pleomorpha str. Grapes]